MSRLNVLPLIALAMILFGCATAEKSSLLGVGIGSVVGGGLGAAASANGSPAMRTQGTLIGVGIGAVLGGLIGHNAYKEQEKKAQARNSNFTTDGFEMRGTGSANGKTPTLKPAQVKVRYVEDQIKDSVFIPAHFEYEISEPARWQEGK